MNQSVKREDWRRGVRDEVREGRRERREYRVKGPVRYLRVAQDLQE